MRVHLSSRATLGAVTFLSLLLFSSAQQEAAAQCRDSRNRRVEIINDTNVTMVKFNASRIDLNDWQEDILGQRVLAPGQRVTANINDGTCACFYDLRAIFSDNDEVIRRKFDVCTGEYWRIYNR